MKAGQFRVRTRLAIRELRKDVGLRRGQVAVPEGFFCRAPRRALNLAQKESNRLKRRFEDFS